jgi:hypothetical protein
MPNQRPSATWIGPMYLTRPSWCVEVSTVWPILNSDMAECYLPVIDSAGAVEEGVVGVVRRSRAAGACRCNALTRYKWERVQLLANACEKAGKV